MWLKAWLQEQYKQYCIINYTNTYPTLIKLITNTNYIIIYNTSATVYRAYTTYNAYETILHHLHYTIYIMVTIIFNMF